MWRRTYFVLILARLYFALSPSYLHPDENFQSLEPIAGRVYSYPVHLTWEYTTTHPIRSSFPLWLVYGLPMYLLRWIWEGAGKGEVAPAVVYWVLRFLMFILSFVLEDWAIHELVQSPRQRRCAILLVASSYVTWTLQTHTFSNSVETLIVMWCLVLIQRILDEKERTSGTASIVLGFLAVLGVFNRITFPAYLLVPGLQLVPHFRRKPFSLLFLLLSATLTTILAIALDTAFYKGFQTSAPLDFIDLIRIPVITPLNNLRYNSSAANLAQHGLHPFYQHITANLPQLLGPAFLVIITGGYRKTMRLAAGLSGVLILSCAPHQEARFLLPAVPLILSSLRLPLNAKVRRAWVVAWVVFNVALGVLMGTYHQGGVVPAQIHLATAEMDVERVFWWKTYSPPIWLLNGRNENLTTVDLMGIKPDKMVDAVRNGTVCDTCGFASPKFRSKGAGSGKGEVLLVAPRSAWWLKRLIVAGDGVDETEREKAGDAKYIELSEVWSYRNHLNLDDLDFGDDGVLPTLRRVVGDRGLVVYKVKRICY